MGTTVPARYCVSSEDGKQTYDLTFGLGPARLGSEVSNAVTPRRIDRVVIIAKIYEDDFRRFTRMSKM